MSVLAAVFPSDASYLAVLEAAGRLAGETPFEVLHLFPAHPSQDEQLAWKSRDKNTAPARDQSRKAIEGDLAERGLKANVRVEVARLTNVGDSLVDRARELGASVIVVGTHGRTGISRLLLGSVAERVVRLAHCDVYVTRPR